jgi:hypothetical protein
LNGDVQGKTKAEQAEKIKQLEFAVIDGQRKITTLEVTNETLRDRMIRLEQRLTENNLSIDKKLTVLDNRLAVIEETERKKPVKVKID